MYQLTSFPDPFGFAWVVTQSCEVEHLFLLVQAFSKNAVRIDLSVYILSERSTRISLVQLVPVNPCKL
jgi:hypothetical protein